VSFIWLNNDLHLVTINESAGRNRYIVVEHTKIVSGNGISRRIDRGTVWNFLGQDWKRDSLDRVSFGVID
jgi:hypothetical protein